MTRVYNQPLDAQGRGLLYRNVGDCARKLLAAEGPRALYIEQVRTAASQVLGW